MLPVCEQITVDVCFSVLELPWPLMSYDIIPKHLQCSVPDNTMELPVLL